MYDDDRPDTGTNKLPKRVTEDELYDDGWTGRDAAISYFEYFDLGVSKMLELRIEKTATVDGTRHHLVDGYSWLLEMVSDTVVEEFLQHNIIERPKIFTRGGYQTRNKSPDGPTTK